MNKVITQRLLDLKAEFEAGQKAMAELEAKQAHLRDTLLRISGAIQVLEEMNEITEKSGSSGENLKAVNG